MVNSTEARHSEQKSKRQQILEAARVIFSQKGYYRATVDDIIALADTGKGTVYNYFLNKEQLFYTLIKETYVPFENGLDKICQAEREPLDKIQAVIALFLSFYLENAQLWRVMMHEVRGFGYNGPQSLTPEQCDKYQAHFAHSIGAITSILKEGIQQGVIKAGNADQAAHWLFSMIVMSVFHKFVNGNIEQSAKTIADTFLYGVAK
ncbi:MAG: TetR/AcrR family transcriptional regulator [Pelosinus sp.]|nr:TetR/AcrR family transcriptional regulator [Pelosinus sp.]